jgi:hypothetical protein
MMTFVVTENGKMEAEGGTHDDCVMALAIAAYVSEDAWVPVQSPTTTLHPKQSNQGP